MNINRRQYVRFLHLDKPTDAGYSDNSPPGLSVMGISSYRALFCIAVALTRIELH
jgi:hypothetical protein